MPASRAQVELHFNVWRDQRARVQTPSEPEGEERGERYGG